MTKKEIYAFLDKEIRWYEDTLKESKFRDGFIKGIKHARKIIKKIKIQNEKKRPKD